VRNVRARMGGHFSAGPRYRARTEIANPGASFRRVILPPLGQFPGGARGLSRGPRRTTLWAHDVEVARDPQLSRQPTESAYVSRGRNAVDDARLGRRDDQPPAHLESDHPRPECPEPRRRDLGPLLWPGCRHSGRRVLDWLPYCGDQEHRCPSPPTTMRPLTAMGEVHRRTPEQLSEAAPPL